MRERFYAIFVKRQDFNSYKKVAPISFCPAAIEVDAAELPPISTLEGPATPRPAEIRGCSQCA
ncbi:MAG: hypothetical protein DMG60_17815 [Acidobacteria bacterium]|nr:MAG: hypothetical protein DMG60_17815 [Acidobacteriota bacterium]